MTKNHRLTLALLILVCLAIFWALGIQRTTNVEDTQEPQGSMSNVSASQYIEDPKPAAPAVGPSPVRSRMKGNMRLKPGQTGIMSYMDMEPGMNGILLVKPEARPDGTIVVESQMFKVPDSAGKDAVFNQVMPDLFDFARYTAIDPEVDEVLKEAIQNTEGMKKAPGARNLIQPGQPAGYKSMVSDINGQKLRGEILNIIVHPLDADEGFEVELDLDTYTLPEK